MGQKDHQGRNEEAKQLKTGQPKKQSKRRSTLASQRKTEKQDNYTGKPLLCMYTNADCLKNKLNEFKVRLSDCNPDIICINEVKPKHMKDKLTESEFSLQNIGYNMFPLNIENDTGRGMLVYTKTIIKAQKVNIVGDFDEVLWIEIQLNGHDTLLLACFYRSGSGSDANNNLMREVINQAMNKKYTYTCFVGDFNYPDISWDTLRSGNESSEDYRFLECIQNNYLIQHVTKPTRVRGTNTPSTLDLILTNDERIIQNIEYHSPLGKSDHSVLKFEILCYSKLQQYRKMKYYFDSANYEAMKNEVSNINWKTEFTGCLDVDSMWNKFNKVLSELIDKFIQHKLVLCNRNTKWDMPMDNRLRAIVKKKHRLWTRYMEDKNPLKRQEYCRIRNKVTKLSKNLRREFERKLSRESKSNPKAVWKYIHSKSKVKEGIADLHIDPGNPDSPTTSNDKHKADILAKFYSSVFTDEPPGDIPRIPNRHCAENMPSLIITEVMVEKRLSELNPNKSPGPDCMHPRLLKELAPQLREPLTLLFNKSLHDGQLPEVWKRAKITAIFKKGDRKHPGNYRPVSLTSIICKVFEKIIRQHVISHFKRNKHFTRKQFGFLDGRSCSLQLLKVLDVWTNAVESGDVIDCIYMDYAKAFDKVPHRRLVGKLSAYGINDDIVRWIEAFLTNRHQQVAVNGELSDLEKVKSGIPQGSVLGPLLFVIYINDLPDLLQSQPYLFADDTKIFKVIKSAFDQKTLQDDLNKLHHWSSTWLLHFHPQKCKSMRINMRPDDPQDDCYKLDSHNLEWTKCEKDIGLLTDSSLNFESHISAKVKKANSTFGLLRRIFEFLDKEAFKPLYQSMVRVHLDYVSSVWSPYKKKDITFIEQVQRRATRQIPGLSNMSYSDRLKSLDLPTLKFRRLKGDMIEVYKILHEIYDSDATLNLPRSTGPTRGHDYKLFQQRSAKDIRKHYFTNRVVKVWNSLPDDVVNAPSVNTFKNRLDKFWENQPMKFDYEEPYMIGTNLKIYLSELD